MRKKRKITYFLEIKSGEANSAIAAYLSELCIGAEAWARQQMDNDGKLHDVCEMPNFGALTVARSIARQDNRISLGYWERVGDRGYLYPAEFLLNQGRIRRSVKYRRAEAATPPPKSRLTSALE
jgi:hypothetical protein